MPKRTHSDFVNGSQLASDSSHLTTDGDSEHAKRLRSRNDDAVAVVRERADDLIASLRALRKDGGAHSVSLLSRELLPVFQSMAASIDTEPRPSLPVRRDLGFEDPVLIMPWTVSDIAPTLPPLPPADPELLQAVFTHPASAAAQRGSMSYDRLEWLGDANLYVVASYLIFSTFGGLSPGRSSQLRERLVRNQTLASYFIEYGLDKLAKLPDRGGTPERREKIYGDMFEAYVAAVAHSGARGGMARTIGWLRILWARTLKTEIEQLQAKPAMGRVREMGDRKPVNEAATAKLRIAQLIRVPGIELRYEDVPDEQQNTTHDKLKLFSVRLYLKGWGEEKKLLGWGSALSKKEAGQKAAMMALENKELIAVYAKKKKAYVEDKARQPEAATLMEACKGQSMTSST